MKVVAVIAEYNPFHNGHLYQLKNIQKFHNADYIIVLMSGDFVQRGEPAIIDKYERCRIALACGADAVFELPVYFALGSAEYFSQGAVSLLDKLGVVDVLHFGSECGDIEFLQECAEMLINETDEYKKFLNFNLKLGKSFPLARCEAIMALSDLHSQEIYNVFSSPNNILALEYIKALRQRNSNITPVTLKRAGADFHCEALPEASLPSATAIRKSLFSSENSQIFSDIKNHVPEICFHALANSTLVFPDDFSQILMYRLFREADLMNRFSHFYDVGIELSNVIAASRTHFSSFSECIQLCKSKNLTYTRICRALMHIILDMTQDTADLLKNGDYCSYARLLGLRVNNERNELMKQIKKNSSIPIITSPAKGLKQLSESALISFKADIHVANIYETVKAIKKFPMSPLNEMTREIIKYTDY